MLIIFSSSSSLLLLLHSSSSVLHLLALGLVLLSIGVATRALVLVAVGPKLNNLKNIYF